MKVFILCTLLAVSQAAAVIPTLLSTGSSGQYRAEDSIGNYNFGYSEGHLSGGTFRKEAGDAFGNKFGSYGLTDADGRSRVVNYVADAAGFRADIQTNEPGVEPKDPAAATINKAIAVAPAPVVSYSAPIAPTTAIRYAAPGPIASTTAVHYTAPAPITYGVPAAPIASTTSVHYTASAPAPITYGVPAVPAPITYGVPAVPAPITYGVPPAPITYGVSSAPLSLGYTHGLPLLNHDVLGARYI